MIDEADRDGDGVINEEEVCFFCFKFSEFSFTILIFYLFPSVLSRDAKARESA